MATLRGIVAAAALPLVISQNQGSQGECIGARYHQVDYDYSDETDENGVPTSYRIAVQPKPEESSNCPPVNGIPTDKAVCVGMNTNDCQSAAQVVKINDFLDCEDCFVGLTTDIFYNLTVERLSLKSVKVGIRDSHLRGKAALHFSKEGSQTAAKGTVPLVDNEVKANINFAAGPIPVNIKFSIPTEVDYEVDLAESVDLHFGAAVDVNLGDHYLEWNSEDGFGPTNTDVGVTWTPTIVADGEVTADLPITLKSKLEVDFEHVLGWNLQLTPSLPLHASLETHWFSSPSVCLSGEADFLVSQDADVHFDYAGFDHTFATFGPSQIYHHHWSSVFNKCVSPGLEDVVV
jgi:hypothetical protein